LNFRERVLGFGDEKIVRDEFTFQIVERGQLVEKARQASALFGGKG
jgi:hypothetical protein